MKIGEAADTLGIATHVLRHWEDVRVIVPGRTHSGHRNYTQEQIARCRIVLSCQGVGMSLAEIRVVLNRSEAERTEVLSGRIADIRRQRAALVDAERFLLHVRSCRHDLITRCRECMEYSDGPAAD